MVTVGWRSTKPVIGPAAAIMQPTPITTATTMMAISSTMPHSRDDRIDRKYHIQQDDLNQYSVKSGRFAFLLDPGCPFQAGMNLARSLGDEEESTGQQNQIAAGQGVSEHGEEWNGPSHDEGQ